MSAEPPSDTSPGSLHQAAIARRAYSIWVERGRPEGEDVAHWLAAEAELRAATSADQQARDTEDDTPITLNAPTRGKSSENRTSHSGQLPPPHQR